MRVWTLAIVVGVSATACADVDTELDDGLRVLIEDNELDGRPLGDMDVPEIDSPKAQLGMRLFFSKTLGGARDTACVSCHHPMLGGSDGLSLPIGVEAIDPAILGPGRMHSPDGAHYDGGPTVPRNSPTTFNIIGWDEVLFHDGRLESLGKSAHANGDDGAGIRTPDTSMGEADPLAGVNLATAQARFPITSAEEMKAFELDEMEKPDLRNYLASRLGGYGEGAGELRHPEYWVDLFRVTFDQPDATAEELITEQSIADAIGEYERTMAFVDSPWSRYVQGDTWALSAAAKRGATLFFTTARDGGANCSACHSGDFFTDESFHNLAMPQLGRGKGDGEDGTADNGRYRETGVEEDLFAFRTPSLLNVEVTGPWTHAGAYETLEDVIRHHLDPAEAVASFDASALDQPGLEGASVELNTLAALAALQVAGDEDLVSIELTDEQVGDLVAFLRSLTDPCVLDRACMERWMPPSDEDPNGEQLSGVRADGTPL
jgi:cytochrome c peroxidase